MTGNMVKIRYEYSTGVHYDYDPIIYWIDDWYNFVITNGLAVWYRDEYCNLGPNEVDRIRWKEESRWI